MVKVIDIDKLMAFINIAQRDEVIVSPQPGVIQPTPTVITQPSVAPTPSGPLGSKTNPIKLNKLMDMVYHGYMAQDSPNGTYGTISLPAYTKLYFEVDTLETAGISAGSFGINTKFYNMAFSVWKSLLDKKTGAYLTELCAGPPSGYRDIVYNNQPNNLDNYKYLYAIDNLNNDTSFNIDVWVTINP